MTPSPTRTAAASCPATCAGGSVASPASTPTSTIAVTGQPRGRRGVRRPPAALARPRPGPAHRHPGRTAPGRPARLVGLGQRQRRPHLAIGGVNVAPRPGDVVLYTPAWGGNTPGRRRHRTRRAVHRRDRGDRRHDAASRSSASAASRADPGRRRRPGRQRIGVRHPPRARPPGPPPAASTASSTSGSAPPSTPSRASAATPPSCADGQPAFPDVDDSFTRARHPRSLVGWNPAGEVVLVTVDGGRADASGMTLARGRRPPRRPRRHRRLRLRQRRRHLRRRRRGPEPPGRRQRPRRRRRPKAGRWHRGTWSARRSTPSWSWPSRPTRRRRRPPPTRVGRQARHRRHHGHHRPGQAHDRRRRLGAGHRRPGGAGAATAAVRAAGRRVDILRNPNTKRPRRQTGKNGKGKKDKDGEEEEYAGDPSIPDWNDIKPLPLRRPRPVPPSCRPSTRSSATRAPSGPAA